MPAWFRATIRLVPLVVGFSLLGVVGLCAFRAVVSIDTLRSAGDAVGNYLQTVGGIYAVLLAFIVYVVWGQFNDSRIAAGDARQHPRRAAGLRRRRDREGMDRDGEA
jgi:uncharacterized membrane protein